jgi:orotidine-5'-phosphate decarboxylase
VTRTDPEGRPGGQGSGAPPGGLEAPGRFADRLEAAIAAKKSGLVVGLDPVLERLPEEVLGKVSGLGGARDAGVGFSTARAAAALALFGEEVVRAVAPHAVALKANTAFFERFGPPGWDVLQLVCRRARAAGLLVIADAKRGDLESTAEAYAEGFLGDLPDTMGPLTDALTVNPYLGSDGLRPFLAAAARGGKGLFVLVRTSNPSASELQDLKSEGRPLYLRVAELVAGWGAELLRKCGLSAVGAVVGATASREAALVRQALPRSPFLVPGFGAQGAGPEEVRPHFLPGGRGALVNASRSVIYAYEKERDCSWQEAIGRAAARARKDLEAVRGTA